MLYKMMIIYINTLKLFLKKKLINKQITQLREFTEETENCLHQRLWNRMRSVCFYYCALY